MVGLVEPVLDPAAVFRYVIEFTGKLNAIRVFTAGVMPLAESALVVAPDGVLNITVARQFVVDAVEEASVAFAKYCMLNVVVVLIKDPEQLDVVNAVAT